jgi:hypothetical protein
LLEKKGAFKKAPISFIWYVRRAELRKNFYWVKRAIFYAIFKKGLSIVS